PFPREESGTGTGAGTGTGKRNTFLTGLGADGVLRGRRLTFVEKTGKKTRPWPAYSGRFVGTPAEKKLPGGRMEMVSPPHRAPATCGHEPNRNRPACAAGRTRQA